MARVLAIVGGGVWLLATAAVALGVHWSARPQVIRRHTTIPVLIRELNSTRPLEGDSWIVTKVNSAHNVLVVNANADRVTDARAIAAQIVKPMLTRGYDEILVYVWSRHSSREYAARRVQWTRTMGYSELVLDGP